MVTAPLWFFKCFRLCSQLLLYFEKFGKVDIHSARTPLPPCPFSSTISKPPLPPFGWTSFVHSPLTRIWQIFVFLEKNSMWPKNSLHHSQERNGVRHNGFLKKKLKVVIQNCSTFVLVASAHKRKRLCQSAVIQMFLFYLFPFSYSTNEPKPSSHLYPVYIWLKSLLSQHLQKNRKKGWLWNQHKTLKYDGWFYGEPHSAIIIKTCLSFSSVSRTF